MIGTGKARTPIMHAPTSQDEVAGSARRIFAVSSSRDRAGVRNMQQLIQLRWIAVVGQVATILVVQYGLDIALPLGLDRKSVV